MNEKLSNQLITKYPRIFSRGEFRDNHSHSFHYVYPEVGDGWFNLLDVAFSLIEGHQENLEKNANLKSRLTNEENNDECVAEDVHGYEHVRAQQIKEKFGGLRLYISGGDDFTAGVVAMAENMSYRLCDVCGKPGHQRDSSWISTRCDDHA
jgi:hypothetical protein